MDTREELRDELTAVLATARDLSPETDKHLADAFLGRVEQQLPALTPSRRHARMNREPVSPLRRGLTAILAVLILVPGAAFAAKGFLNRWAVGGVPSYYMWSLLLVTAAIVATMYFERHSVHVQISRRKSTRESLPRT